MRRLFTITAAGLMLVLGLAGPAAASPSGQEVSGASGRVLSAVSVQAEADPAGCGGGNLCFWTGYSASGDPGELSGRNASWGAFSRSGCPSGTWNNCASYLYNNGNSCDSVTWDGTSYTYGSAGALVLPRNQGYSLSGDSLDNAISSNSWVRPGYPFQTSSSCGGPALY